MCEYCIFTMDWISRISYVHIGQYYQRRIYDFWCPGQDFQTVPPTPLSDGPSDDGFQLTLSVSKFTY